MLIQLEVRLSVSFLGHNVRGVIFVIRMLKLQQNLSGLSAEYMYINRGILAIQDISFFKLLWVL